MNKIKSKSEPSDLASTIKELIVRMGQSQCIKPDGKLDEGFILTCLTQNNKRVAHEHRRILAAYDKLKTESDFMKESKAKVNDQTLKSYVFFHEALVRPIRTISSQQNDFLYTGEIIKLPEKTSHDYEDGEGWKALVDKVNRFNVGDKIMYSYKTNIVLDSEPLHLVCSITGKILE